MADSTMEAISDNSDGDDSTPTYAQSTGHRDFASVTASLASESTAGRSGYPKLSRHTISTSYFARAAYKLRAMFVVSMSAYFGSSPRLGRRPKTFTDRRRITESI